MRTKPCRTQQRKDVTACGLRREKSTVLRESTFDLQICTAGFINWITMIILQTVGHLSCCTISAALFLFEKQQIEFITASIQVLSPELLLTLSVDPPSSSPPPPPVCWLRLLEKTGLAGLISDFTAVIFHFSTRKEWRAGRQLARSFEGKDKQRGNKKGKQACVQKRHQNVNVKGKTYLFLLHLVSVKRDECFTILIQLCLNLTVSLNISICVFQHLQMTIPIPPATNKLAQIRPPIRSLS